MFVMMALGILVPSACNKLPINNGNGQVNLDDLLSKEDKLYQDLVIQSAYKGQKMTYSVWLPNGYDESKTYPFLYLFHGYEYGDQSHLDRCWVEKGNAREIAKQYVKDGGVPMVIIMPNGLSDFYSGSWEQYFHEELMPKVEEGFKCNGKRAIAGLSMGGYGTLYHALKYPRKFTYAYAMSPATAVTFTAFIDAQADKKVFPPFTIEVGTEDGTVNNADSETLATYMKEHGLTCEWISRAGTHDWKFWQECLPKTLKRVGESFK
jgi:S-formylglutathione hydrolase FrmB